MKVGSLFAGIGGFDLGLERAGFEIAWQVEIDPYCQRVLAKHWPHVTRYGDIRAIDWGTVEPVDLICGGFPCQPVSITGSRKGDTDERWLWPEFVRCICVVRPRFIVVENVSGLRFMGMGTVLSDLARCGYDVEWQSIPASAIGAPHDRERLWIIANASRERMGILAGSSGCHDIKRHVQEITRGRFAGTPWAQATGFTGSPTALVQDARSRRINDGIPGQVDRLRSLGNAIVPQIAEWLGRQIMRCK